MKTYIGIDNGVSGTIAYISEEGVGFDKTPVIKVQDYTKAKKLISRLDAVLFDGFLARFEPSETMVVIERPLVNPSRLRATESALRCHEAMLVLLERRDFPYMFIDSKEWQRALLPKGCMGEELKKASLDIGNRLFPQFKDVKHPDRDGLLIAEYARRVGL